MMTPGLPTKPLSATLSGRLVVLKPLIIERDSVALFEASNGTALSLGKRSIGAYDCAQRIWHHLFSGPFKTPLELASSLQGAVDDARGLCLCAFVDNRPVGVANFMNNYPEHLKIELGGIWYSPLVQGTGVNTEATYLMLTHAFNLGYQRVEWKCDALNEPSRRAALKMGFTFEGIQEQHMVIKGRNRDTAWYCVLKRHWPEVKEKLERLLHETKSAL